MKFNADKCKIMHLGRQNPRYEYTIDGTKLLVTDEEKDIAVVIQSNLKLSGQCEKAARTASAALRQNTNNFQFRDRHVFVKLYKQYVRPHLECVRHRRGPRGWRQTGNYWK